MRDILSDLEAGKQLSDENPIVRAQKQMLAQLPKRFYEKAEVADVEDAGSQSAAVADQGGGPDRSGRIHRSGKGYRPGENACDPSRQHGD